MKQSDIPTALRICAGTDGSVTKLLEVLTNNKVTVKTLQQEVIKATGNTAKLLMIKQGDPVNHREVLLTVLEKPYVFACSLSPVNNMPQGVRDDLMKADIPIGRILREHKLETRRDILKIEIQESKDDIFNNIPVLSREYMIIHNKCILMWINEHFPVDGRWNV